MLQDFKANLWTKIHTNWTLFCSSYYSINSEYGRLIHDLFDRNDLEVAVLIDMFQVFWHYYSKTFPDAILSHTNKIEALLQIWADYHTLELKLEELKL